MSKGQISYFILMALILVIAFNFIFYLNNNFEKSNNQVSTEFKKSYEPVKVYVEECIRVSAENSLISNAYQGGFYSKTNNIISNQFFIIPFYSKDRTELIPTLKQLEEQLSYSTNYRILGCVDNFKVFKEKGFDINFEKPHSKATILENQVLFEVNFPIAVKINEKNIKSFDTFLTAIPSRYKLIYTVADEISSSLSKTPDKLCISCLIDYGAKNDLKILVTNYDKKTISFTIIDEKVRIGSEFLIFNFAHKIGDIVE